MQLAFAWAKGGLNLTTTVSGYVGVGSIHVHVVVACISSSNFWVFLPGGDWTSGKIPVWHFFEQIWWNSRSGESSNSSDHGASLTKKVCCIWGGNVYWCPVTYGLAYVQPILLQVAGPGSCCPAWLQMTLYHIIYVPNPDNLTRKVYNSYLQCKTCTEKSCYKCKWQGRAQRAWAWDLATTRK